MSLLLESGWLDWQLVQRCAGVWGAGSASLEIFLLDAHEGKTKKKKNLPRDTKTFSLLHSAVFVLQAPVFDIFWMFFWLYLQLLEVWVF